MGTLGFPRYQHPTVPTQSCLKCPPGYRVDGDVECAVTSDGSASFPNCVACPDGYYINNWSLLSTCHRKKACATSLNMIALSDGSVTSDRICGCFDGYQWSAEGEMCLPITQSENDHPLVCPTPRPCVTVPCPPTVEKTFDCPPIPDVTDILPRDELCDYAGDVILSYASIVLIIIACIFVGWILGVITLKYCGHKFKCTKKTTHMTGENGATEITKNEDHTLENGAEQSLLGSTSSKNKPPAQAAQCTDVHGSGSVTYTGGAGNDDSEYCEIKETPDGDPQPDSVRKKSDCDLALGEISSGSLRKDAKRRRRLDHACRIIEKQLSTNEHQFMRQGLLLEPQEIHKLDHDYHSSVEKKVMHALEIWKNREGKEATADKLLDKLEDVGRKDIKDIIQEIFDSAPEEGWC